MGFWASLQEWLGNGSREPQATGLLMIPLTGTEMARQAGISAIHEERLGMLPTHLVDAMRKVLQNDAEATLAAAAPATTTQAAVFFKPGEPRTFEEYGGQKHITDYLAAFMQGIPEQEPLAIDPQCFAGTAGGGKTLLAKVVTQELRVEAVRRSVPLPELIEVFTSDIPNVAALDRLMRRVVKSPGCVVFIDELHTVDGKEHWTKFLEVLENKRYEFEGEAQPTILPPFTILSATTDYGTLTQPWRRRFHEQRFVRATPEQLLTYIQHRNTLPIADSAARAIVDRTHWGGAPWEALWAYKMAVVFARARHSSSIKVEDVERVWTTNQVDDLGLRPVDRDVMKALFMSPRNRRDRRTGGEEFYGYAASEDTVVQMAGIDRSEYKDYIRPKLMSRGLLRVQIGYGQMLTDLAIQRYAHLRG